MRLISADSLVKLVKIKESAEEGTVGRIRELLIPFEYTRVDRIIELAFTAVNEVGEGFDKEESRSKTRYRMLMTLRRGPNTFSSVLLGT
jgi:hypothetical protein